MVGRATSGACGYAVDKSLAVGYVEPEASAPGTDAGDRDPLRAVPGTRDRRLAVGPGECKVAGVGGHACRRPGTEAPSYCLDGGQLRSYTPC